MPFAFFLMHAMGATYGISSAADATDQHFMSSWSKTKKKVQLSNEAIN